MKKIHLAIYYGFIILGILQTNNMTAQISANQTWTKKEAVKWLNTRDWAHGLKLKVFDGVNAIEFAKQYHKNKVHWDKAFAYLKETNLDSIAPGKYSIDGDNVYATVIVGKTKAFEDKNWEAHRKYIDIQYVINGKEKMGVAPSSPAIVLEEYNETEDVELYMIAKTDCKFYKAEPGIFFIFFPEDAHQPGIKIEGYDSDKKMVIKVKAD
jgi:YhcH/YjgK/YiaL family protein